MDGKIFASSLVQLKGDELRMVYTLLFKTNIIGLISAKTKNLFAKNTDYFNESLQLEMKKIELIPDEQLQLALFLKLTEILELKGTHYDSPVEIEQQSAHIIEAAHQSMLKEEKDYRTFVDSAENQAAIQLMIQYQMQKLFSTFDGKFRELDEKQTNEFTEKIYNFLQGLPAEKQNQLKSKLNIDDITNETIHQVMITQGSVVVLSIIVEVAGFVAYTTLTTAMATTMALIGVTLPFGVYTFATSLLSLLVNPFVLIPLVLGSGGWLISRQNKNLRQKLVPVVILQMTLPLIVGLSDGKETDFTVIINEWQQQKAQQTKLLTEQQRLLSDIAFNEKACTGLEKENELVITQLAANKKQLDVIRLVIQQAIYTVPETQQSPLFQSLLHIISQKQQTIAELEVKKAINAARTGFWNTISSTLDNTSLTSDIRKLQKEIADTERKLSDELIAMESNVLLPERTKVAELTQQNQILLNERTELGKQIHTIRDAITELESSLHEVKHALKSLQKNYYGLQHLI